MMLGIPGNVICSDILDAPVIHIAVCNQAAPDQFTQPRGGVWVILVVVGAVHAIHHPSNPAHASMT